MSISLDDINRRTFRSRGALKHYRLASGWLDPGERAALEHVEAEVKNESILDIGMGAGRTTELLLKFSSNHIGVDYTPEMVASARRRCPGANLQEMDARALTFADATFKLVVFSANGIDNADLPGRLQILREVHRVLVPGGIFVFSSLNREGPSSREKWWDLHHAWHDKRWQGRLGLLRMTRHIVMGGLHALWHRPFVQQGSGISVVTVSAHNFGLVNMLTTMEQQVRQLEDNGFRVEAVYDDAQGQLVTEQSDYSEVD